MTSKVSKRQYCKILSKVVPVLYRHRIFSYRSYISAQFVDKSSCDTVSGSVGCAVGGLHLLQYHLKHLGPVATCCLVFLLCYSGMQQTFGGERCNGHRDFENVSEFLSIPVFLLVFGYPTAFDSQVASMNLPASEKRKCT